MSTILIAEDTLDIIELYALILRDEGYTVIETHDGMEAYQWLESNPCPDLLITDYMMPRTNGAELVALVRLNEKIKHLPIIVSSGSHQDEIRKAFMQNEAIFMPKPVDIDYLIKLVSQTIEEYRQ